MSDSFRSVGVYVRNVYAGNLQEIAEGYQFSYDSYYLEQSNASPVSLTLPLQSKPYISKTIFPFFDGLIPEGWLLDLAIKNWKINANDRFGLLLVTCKDPIGDVSLGQVTV